LLYLNNDYGNVPNIFSDPLEFTCKKIILSKKYSEAFGPLAYTPKVTPMGLFENHPSFLPDSDDT